MLQAGKKIVAYNFKEKIYDTGNKIGLLKANIEFGMRNPETKDDLEEYLKERKKNK